MSGSSISLVVFGARPLLLCPSSPEGGGLIGEDELVGWVIEASTSWAQVMVGVHLGSVSLYEDQMWAWNPSSSVRFWVLWHVVAGSPHPFRPWLGLSRLSEANWFAAIISL